MINKALPSFWAVVPAAGIGSRMRADRPKQYLDLAGRTVIEHTLSALLHHPSLQGLVVSLAADDRWWPDLACASDHRITRAAGGKERADSVLSGLLQLAVCGASDSDWVLVHDAARPNLCQGDVDRLLCELADDEVGGLLAVPVKDTLKRVDPYGRVEVTVDRSVIWQAYTPQMFRLGHLRQTLSDALAAGVMITDEASAMEWAGYRPRVIEGRSDNIKITRPEDLVWLTQLWRERRHEPTPTV
ncbi:2-C-methyl-D-erythritol 4-phosphate cytidylyltransferase [Pseudomonas asuensis]|uniref:2-C-methyl-D-erythritol 4-phosphate cytidylyltransferase n=1 Tax=Pseudomonas asuensis TaxID=1825787 RepID=A0ABQ2GG59_9PSED|nr:2-C-methyl-D-erythritol 4-phosphate cytidylyltransferase [Pseudomonas asuensis]GGL94895.1 2-C-methyl-D-erythritol 4-phosphate cytidylyltransferase [Pseudomonas asuensis]